MDIVLILNIIIPIIAVLGAVFSFRALIKKKNRK